jgi:hypothetical protein
MSSWLANKPNIMNADVFVASIVVAEDGKNTVEYKIKDCWDIRYFLCGIRRGEILNIKGIGKLKVLQVIDYENEDEYLYFYELIFSCRKIADYEEKQTAIVPYSDDAARARWLAILDEDYARTWG